MPNLKIPKAEIVELNSLKDYDEFFKGRITQVELAARAKNPSMSAMAIDESVVSTETFSFYRMYKDFLVQIYFNIKRTILNHIRMFGKGKKMSKITIDRKTFEIPSGASISIANGNITINGNTVCEGATGKVDIVVVKGDLVSLECDANVTCENISGTVKAGGNIKCNNVGLNVNAGGNIHCGQVAGNVSAGGNIVIKK